MRNHTSAAVVVAFVARYARDVVATISLAAVVQSVTDHPPTARTWVIAAAVLTVATIDRRPPVART